MTKKVKMKKKIGYTLVDSKGRWVPEQVGSCDCSPEALVVHEDKDELYEGMYYTMVKCGCTFYECHRSYAEIPEWEDEFDLRFVNSIAGKKGYRYIRQYSTIPRDIKDFIKRLLTSHSKVLQERHEAGLLKLVNDLREDYKCPDKDCAPCYSRESVLSAVESYATHLNPKS